MKHNVIPLPEDVSIPVSVSSESIRDLNCDLGENEGRQRTAALMRHVTSANIACGGHAGEVESMRFAVEQASKHGVKIGAHPGLADREHFGRRVLPISGSELKTLLLHQVSGLEKIAQAAGARLRHIKLHGALYHMVEEQRELREAYLEIVRELWPELTMFCLADGQVWKQATAAGMSVWGEGFLDRGYMDGARLVPRGQPGAMLSRAEFVARLESIRRDQSVRTWCIHADGPDAVLFARLARRRLE